MSSVEGQFNTYPPIAGEANKCFKEKRAGSVFKVTGGYDPNRLTPEMCREACAGLNDIFITAAAITEQKICLCGKNAGWERDDIKQDCYKNVLGKLFIVSDATNVIEEVDNAAKFCSNDTCFDGTDGCAGTRGRFKVYEVKSSKPTTLEFTSTLNVLVNLAKRVFFFSWHKHIYRQNISQVQSLAIQRTMF